MTVVILTKDEERHIARALASVETIADHVVVVDSGSTDRTCALAEAAGATVLVHDWINPAAQFNWALEQLPPGTDWVIRLDADEVVTETLARTIQARLGTLPPDVAGVVVKRRMTFLGRPIRWGGVFPIRLLRLLRHGRGRSEHRWMDEHIYVDGDTVDFEGEIIDDNLNSLTWWTSKHNTYASREVIDILNAEYDLFPRGDERDLQGGRQARLKRWLKESVYARLPGGLRATLYFLYRYVIRLGFLDGKEGTAFHVLQGFWYRYLVDVKLHETRAFMRREGVDAATAIHAVLGIDVRPQRDVSPPGSTAMRERA